MYNFERASGTRGHPCFAWHRLRTQCSQSGVQARLPSPLCMQALENGVDVKMITGDQVIIAKEMSRMLGLGDNIKDAGGLPTMEAGEKVRLNHCVLIGRVCSSVYTCANIWIGLGPGFGPR